VSEDQKSGFLFKVEAVRESVDSAPVPNGSIRSNVYLGNYSEFS